jgi:dipeptidyl aminopeptidase/acylaminoacyl peptidase
MALANGRTETARHHLLRAFSYYRSAEYFLEFTDPQRVTLYDRAVACFRSGVDLSRVPPQDLEVPYEGLMLKGLLFPPENGVEPPWPAVIFLSGLDAYPEENFFRGVRHVTKRGMACVLVNCPGQGFALRHQGLTARPDYEVPIAAVVDALVHHQQVDARRIAMLAESMGGYYGTRAAAIDKRIAAISVCGALFDVLQDFYDHYPPARPHIRWVVGAVDDAAARQSLHEYNLEGIIGGLDRPLLVVHGEDDVMVPVASARRMYAGATGPKTLKVYASGEPGAEHGQMDARASSIPLMTDWLAAQLSTIEAER